MEHSWGPVSHDAAFPERGPARARGASGSARPGCSLCQSRNRNRIRRSSPEAQRRNLLRAQAPATEATNLLFLQRFTLKVVNSRKDVRVVQLNTHLSGSRHLLFLYLCACISFIYLLVDHLKVHGRGARVAQSVKCLTLRLSSGLNLRVMSSSPVLGSMLGSVPGTKPT